LSPWPEEKLQLKKPQNKYECSLWVGVILIITAKIAKYILVLKKTQISEAQYIVPVIGLIGETLLLMIIMRAGVHLFKTNTNAKRGRFLIIVANILFLILIGSSTMGIYTMSYMTGLGTQMSREIDEEMSTTLALPDWAPESHEQLNKSYAQIKYIQDGVIMDFVTAKGVKEVYKPTDEDIRLRKSRVAMFQAIRYQKIILAYWCVLFIVTSAALVLKKKAP
jgi:hypothetical protein